MAGKGLVDDGVRTAAEGKGNSGVLAWNWRRGVVGELHGSTVKLTRGLGWLEGACGDGSTAAQSSSALMEKGGGGVPGKKPGRGFL